VTTAERGPPAGGLSWLVIQLLERCDLRCSIRYEWGESRACKSLPGLAELDLVARGQVRRRRYYATSAHPIARTTARRRNDS
jgi:hypothetical protein